MAAAAKLMSERSVSGAAVWPLPFAPPLGELTPANDNADKRTEYKHDARDRLEVVSRGWHALREPLDPRRSPWARTTAPGSRTHRD